MTEERLDRGTEALVHLSAALAFRDRERLGAAMERVLAQGAPHEGEEVILQSYLFLGYPIALNAFALWRELSGREAPAGREDDWQRWQERGTEVCRTVYGGQYGGLRRNVRALHPDMERWMVVEGYGKVLGRPGLTLVRRELCIAALLAVLGAPRQLYSHLRGALNAGAAPGEVDQTLRIAAGYLEEEAREEMREVWGQVKERAKEREALPGAGV